MALQLPADSIGCYSRAYIVGSRDSHSHNNDGTPFIAEIWRRHGAHDFNHGHSIGRGASYDAEEV